MLKELHIKNFALIDQFQVEFQSGLNILTGETGAGKSIIINALNLVLGCRADLECIRDGHDSATVEALFDSSQNNKLKKMSEHLGMELEEGELIVKRIVSRSGKNKVLVNGSLAPLSMLSNIGDGLADIHGQHQHQTLLVPENHLLFLDAFGDLGKDSDEIRKLENRYRELKRQIEKREDAGRERARKKDQLQYEISEIKKAGLAEGEEEELLSEMKKLKNAETLASSVEKAFSELYDSDSSAMDIIRQANNDLTSVSEIDPDLTPFKEASNSILIQLEDLSSGLRDYANGIEYNPEKLQECEDRFAEIMSLKRKYGSSISEILEYFEKIQEEFSSLESEEQNFEKVEEELDSIQVELQNQASILAGKREDAARKFSKLIEKELADMNMEKVKFLVEFVYEKDEDGPFTFKKKPVKLNPHGFGRGEFLFSSNPGEKPRPLSKVASGGEISRVMLALKNILPGKEDVPTMVFDEVDSGIGGKVAGKVGEKLKKISKGRQVLCITHLPQIAAMADAHYFIEKSFSQGRTTTVIRGLNKKERIEEIARMSGGAVITDATRRHAKEMIEAI